MAKTAPVATHDICCCVREFTKVITTASQLEQNANFIGLGFIGLSCACIMQVSQQYSDSYQGFSRQYVV